MVRIKGGNMPEITDSGQSVVKTQIGVCTKAFGTVRAVSDDGEARQLHYLSPVFLNDHISTGHHGKVSISLSQLTENSHVELGRLSKITFDQETLNELLPVPEEEQISSVEQIQLDILAGSIDLTTDLPASAAGPTDPGISARGGGRHIVRFDLIGDETTPVSGNLGTTGVINIFSSGITASAAAPAEEPPATFSTSSFASPAAEAASLSETAPSSEADNSLLADDVQDAILVDEEGNFLIADLSLAYNGPGMASVTIAPLDEDGNRVQDGALIYENGQPLQLQGQFVYWQDNGDGSWSAVTSRLVTTSEDEQTSEEHEEENQTESLLFYDSEGQLTVTITAVDYSHGGSETSGMIHANGQGAGVGNPFINLDISNGAVTSEKMIFSFSSAVDSISFNIDHLSGASGSNTAEIAQWTAYLAGAEVASGTLIGQGQGSSAQADQTLSIGDSDPLLVFDCVVLSCFVPTNLDPAEEVSAQGYRVGDFTLEYTASGVEYEFYGKLKTGNAHSGESGTDSDHGDNGASGEDSDTDDNYTSIVLFTISPEMNSDGTYSGMYVVEQENNFHDNTFSISLTGAQGGKAEVKEYSDGEMTVVITATDHSHQSGEEIAGEVHANEQGMGISNTFINMDSEGSEVLHFAFQDADGDPLSVREITLGIDHLSEAHGEENLYPETALWTAYYIEEDGTTTEVGSGSFDGYGQGSGSQADQLLTISITGSNGEPVYFNALDMSFADNSLHGEIDEECGQGYRISSISGILDPGDHTFDFEADMSEDSLSTSTVLFEVTFDGDGVVIGEDDSEVISGSSQNDYLNGSGEYDVIYGNDGNDILIGGDGDDLLFGGDGEDQLVGGDGVDALFGDNSNQPDNSADRFDTDEEEDGEVYDYAPGEGDTVSPDLLDNLVPISS